MNIVDPAGLLQRVPELGAIASANPTISEALRSGKPHKVYRALWWASLLGRLPEMHRAQARSLLARRRLFLEPITSAPGLFTLNGVGVRVYGESEREDDGLSIGVHFIVVVFVPVFPLGAYLYRSEGNQYRFFGKAPLGGITWAWKNGVAALAGMGLLAAGYGAFHASRFADVWVVNALPVDVQASVGEATATIAAGSRLEMEVPSGDAHVRILLPDGALFEEGELEAKAGKDLVLWNVGGLAPLYVEKVIYATSPPPNPEPEILCGQTAVVRGNLDHVFEDPPESISLPKGSGSVTHTHVDQEGTDWRICAGWAASANIHSPVGQTILRALDNPVLGREGLMASLAIRAENQDFSEIADWLGARVAASAEVDDHRLYQSIMESAGRMEELRPVYAARHEAHPDDVDATYLYARLLPAPEALTLANQGLAKSPDHLYLLRTRSFAHYESRRFEEAAADMARSRELAPDRFFEQATIWLETHAALGRYDVAAEACQPQPSPSPDLVLSCRRLAALSGEEIPSPVPEDETLAGATLLEARLGVDADPADLGEGEPPEVLAIYNALHKSPEAGLAALQAAPDLPTLALDEESALILFGAALAAGDTASAERMRSPLGRQPAWPGLLAFVESGVQRAEFEDATHPIRAVAELARSRMPGLSAAERKALRDSARRDDLLHGMVAMGLARWPG